MQKDTADKGIRSSLLFYDREQYKGLCFWTDKSALCTLSCRNVTHKRNIFIRAACF